MIHRAQDILFDDTGQLVTFHAPQGRPTSVTSVTVYDQHVGDDGTAITALGTPTVTTAPSTTVDATSGAGQSNPRLINVAATTGFSTTREDPREQYLITGVAGEREWFQVAEIVSAASVLATAPLQHTYVSSDLVETTRMQATIDTTFVAEKNNISGALHGPTARWRVRWDYEFDSRTWIADSYFDLVRYPGAHEITAIDIDNELHGWLDLIPENHASDLGQRLIDNGYRMVEIAFIATGKADQLARDNSLVNHLVILATLERWAYARYQQAGSGQLRQAWVDANDIFQSQLDQLVRVTTRIPMAIDQGGGAHKVAAAHLFRR